MKKSVWSRCVLSLLVIVCMVVLAFGCSDDSSSDSHLVVKNKQYHLNDDTIGFKTKESFEKYLQFARQKDYTAGDNYGAACLLTGEAIRFNKGDVVFVSDTALWLNMAFVHKTGEVAEYWVGMPYLDE